MTKAIQQLASGLTVGYAALGLFGEEPGSVRQQVYDGDTITVRTTGNFGVRFLGVDAPELGIPLPGEGGFPKLSDPRWDEFLEDPFAEGLPPFEPPLDEALVGHLKERVGSGAAVNHYRLGQAAEDALEAEVSADMEALGQSEEEFRFFLAFAYEVVDGYGRFLCFVNRSQSDPDEPEPRPKSYNERLLAAGAVVPYQIWPNVNPFRKEGSVAAAVPRPGTAASTTFEDESQRASRESVREARRRGMGVYDPEDPLRLLPFEIRFLAGRKPPPRWVIDLSKDDDALIPPQQYPSVANPEDRLFIPEEYVPLFVEAGWRRRT